MNKVSASSEDYLKTIVVIGGSPKRTVRSVEIARKMCVSKTAVNKAPAQLKKAGLVKQGHYGRVSLTEDGFAYGQKLCKRHLYLIAFPTKELGMAPDIGERDACRIEHAISDECFEKWAAYIDERDLIEAVSPNLDAMA